MASSDYAAARRTLAWGLVLIVLIVVAAVGVGIVRGTTGMGTRLGGPPAPPRITQQVVVERLQTVSKLVATEMTLRDVVIYEQTRFASTKRALLVVTGRVSAGIDLSQGTSVRIDSVTHRITISLPPAQITSVDVVDLTTYDERAGLLNPFRPEDRDAIQRRVRAQLVTAAQQSGILAHADQSAAAALTTLLGQDGYTVQIDRPPVQVKPAG